MPIPNRAFHEGITSKRDLFRSREFNGELACRTCETPYSGPYEDVYSPRELVGVSGFCPTCGAPYWDEE